MSDRTLKDEIEQLMQTIALALKEEDDLLKDIPGNWVTDRPEKVMYGLCSRREPHLVFAAAARLRQDGYLVVLEDGYEGHKTEYRLKCDLAIKLKSQQKWLWLEFKSVPMKNANDMVGRAGKDVKKLQNMGTADSRNLPHGIVLVGFEPAGRTLKTGLDALWQQFAEEHSLSRWPIRGVVDFPSNSRTDWYNRCSVAYWVRLTPGAGSKKAR